MTQIALHNIWHAISSQITMNVKNVCIQSSILVYLVLFLWCHLCFR